MLEEWNSARTLNDGRQKVGAAPWAGARTDRFPSLASAPILASSTRRSTCDCKRNPPHDSGVTSLDIEAGFVAAAVAHKIVLTFPSLSFQLQLHPTGPWSAMRLTFSSPAEYPSGKSGTRNFINDLDSWYTRTCDGVDTAAETDRLVKLMEEDRNFFLLARPIVVELRLTSDDPTPPNPNLNEFLDRVKHLQPRTSTSTRVLGLPRTDRAMAIHRTGELLEHLRKIEPMSPEDLAATEKYREALKKYSGK